MTVAGSADPKDILRKLAEWLATPEGQAELRRANEAAKDIAEMFRKARDISWERLHARFTI